MRPGYLLLISAAAVLTLMAGPGEPARAPTDVFRDAEARTAITRLGQSTQEFKHSLDKALDDSVLNGSALEDTLNGWANLLGNEIGASARAFLKAGKRAHRQALTRFSDHWENAMMAATAINRAMIRRGFAPEPERQWSGIRQDMNSVAHALRAPALPDMTEVLFRPATRSTVSRTDLKELMQKVRQGGERFDDNVKHKWLAKLRPAERHVLDQWTDDLNSAIKRMAAEFEHQASPQFEFHFEECLMLGAGLNRTMLLRPAGAALDEWTRLRDELNTLALRFGYPAIAKSL